MNVDTIQGLIFSNKKYNTNIFLQFSDLYWKRFQYDHILLHLTKIVNNASYSQRIKEAIACWKMLFDI